MTACAIETAPQNHRATRSPQPDTAPRPAPDGPAGPAPGGGRDRAERAAGDAAAQWGPAPLTLAADGSYAARLAVCRATGERFPERWTLAGPEPYAVPLPAEQPEEADSEVLPLTDGRVLIRRRVADRHVLSLLYPAGPGTGELPLGFIVCGELALLPPAPCGTLAYALAPGERSTHVWLVHGGSFGPEHVAEVPGRCTAGNWLDRTGRLLALDREWDGRVKTVVVDLGRGGETTPLLQITADSDDRLVLADPDSGLLLVRSNAPGRERLGWGVLGSSLPVRFPDCLDPRPADPRTADLRGTETRGSGPAHTAVTLTPFAAQPGQVLTPENCAVAFRLTPTRSGGASWVAVWRPAERRLLHLAPPPGWLPGTGLWTRDGELRLPYATPQTTCGLARVRTADLAAEPASRPRPQVVAPGRGASTPAYGADAAHGAAGAAQGTAGLTPDGAAGARHGATGPAPNRTAGAAPQPPAAPRSPAAPYPHPAPLPAPEPAAPPPGHGAPSPDPGASLDAAPPAALPPRAVSLPVPVAHQVSLPLSGPHSVPLPMANAEPGAGHWPAGYETTVPAHERCTDPYDSYAPDAYGPDDPPSAGASHGRADAAVDAAADGRGGAGRASGAGRGVPSWSEGPAAHHAGEAEWQFGVRPGPAAPRPVPLQQAPLDGGPASPAGSGPAGPQDGGPAGPARSGYPQPYGVRSDGMEPDGAL
ncbi:hypothetical protein ACMA1D_04050 [Streptomyces sp. 796.1]|uniref:hypothetical protein n=1 Tax=Streptomyces sp. 796.1 TaxID=3163029 RepID=UPI0039C971B7